MTEQTETITESTTTVEEKVEKIILTPEEQELATKKIDVMVALMNTKVAIPQLNAKNKLTGSAEVTLLSDKEMNIIKNKVFTLVNSL